MSIQITAAQLDESETQLNAELYENSPDCIKILNLDGTIMRVSPGGRVALELDRADQFDGTGWPSLWPGSERPLVEQAIADGRRGKRAKFSAFSPTAKGSPRWWDVVVTPITDASEFVRGLLVVSRDVTELVLAREALVQANARKDEFLTILAHELRNPLSALAMAATVLKRSDGELAQLAMVSGLISRQVGHISRLSENLLDISRIARGEVNLKIEEFDFREIVQDVADQLDSILSSKNQVLHKSLPEIPVIVEGDRVRLAQVLGNIVANASRYSPANSSIDLLVRIDGEFVTISVSDNGQGIARDFLPRLFDMHAQGQSTTGQSAAGVGLGLAIVKGLVELHGGTVRAESEGVGMGSTFVIVLPLKEAVGTLG